jgi:trehalose 6-phosphate synthase
MMEKLRDHGIQQWFADFVDALQESAGDKAAAAPPVAELPTLWPPRAVQSGARIH